MHNSRSSLLRIVVLVIACVVGDCIHTCVEPSAWQPYLTPAVVKPIYTYKGYECNGPLHQLSLDLGPSAKIVEVPAIAIQGGARIKAEAGPVGQAAVSTEVDRTDVIQGFLQGNTFRSDFTASILYLEAPVLVYGEEYPGLEDRGSYLAWEDGTFGIYLRKPSKVQQSTYLQLGAHNVCDDGVCGPSICAPGILQTGFIEVRGVNFTVQSARRRRFVEGYVALGMAVWNRAQIHAMQKQIDKLVDFGRTQTGINDRLIASGSTSANIDGVRVYQTKCFVSALQKTTKTADYALLSQITLESLESLRERNRMRQDRVADLNAQAGREYIQAQLNHNFAEFMSRADPYAAVETFQGEMCPPLEARFTTRLEVRQCQAVNATFYLPDLPPYPRVQHYLVDGRVYHENGRCQVDPGLSTVSDTALIQKLSQNSSHVLMIRDGNLVLVSKQEHVVNGEYPKQSLVLPNNELGLMLESRDNLSSIQNAQAIDAAGLNDVAKRLIQEAADARFKGGSIDILGFLANALSLGGLMSCLKCVQCCPCVDARCCIKSGPWVIASIVSSIFTFLYPPLTKLWAWALGFIPCFQGPLRKVSRILCAAPTSEDFAA